MRWSNEYRGCVNFNAIEGTRHFPAELLLSPSEIREIEYELWQLYASESGRKAIRNAAKRSNTGKLNIFKSPTGMSLTLSNPVIGDALLVGSVKELKSMLLEQFNSCAEAPFIHVNDNHLKLIPDLIFLKNLNK